MSRYDLVVIGGGSTGLTAPAPPGVSAPARCSSKADGWARTAGGRGAYGRGAYVPSKALLHVAARRPAAPLPTGSRRSPGPADLPAAMAEGKRAIGAIEPRDSAEALAGYGVEVVHGAASFTGPGP